MKSSYQIQFPRMFAKSLLASIFLILISGCLDLGSSDSSQTSPGEPTAPETSIVNQAPWNIGTPTNVDEYKRKCPSNSIYIDTKSYTSIQAAITSAVSGDVILVGKGNYNEYISINNKKGIKLYSQCQPQIYGISLQKSQDIEIDGFDIRYKSTNLTGVLIGKIEDDETDNHDNYAGNDSKNIDRKISSLSNKVETSTEDDKKAAASDDQGKSSQISSSDKKDESSDNKDSKPEQGKSDKGVIENDDKDTNPDKNANYRIIFKNSNIEGFPVKGYGIWVSEHNHEITILNNAIHNNLGNGVFLSPAEKTTSVTLTKNVITQNGYNGIILKGENKFTFTENNISQNGLAGIPANGYGLKFLGEDESNDRDNRSSIAFSSNYIIYNLGASVSRKSSKDIRFYKNLRTPSSKGNFSTAGIEPGCGLYADIEAPKIQIFNADNYLTRFPDYLFLAHVTDMGLSNVKAYLNGAQFYSSVVGDIAALVTLREGVNVIEVAAIDYAGNRSSKKLTQVVLDTVPPVLSQVNPANNAILYTNVLPYSVPVSISVNEKLSSLKFNQTAAILADDNTASQTVSVPTAGVFTLTAQASDLAGNISTSTSSFTTIFDNTPPVATIGNIPSITNQTQLTIPITVSDTSPTDTGIKVNGTQILITRATNFNVNVVLSIEGVNAIEIESIDAAGNHSAIASANIIKDTTPPQIQITAPLDNTEIDKISFALTGKSNEKLKSLTVNGSPLSLSPDQLSFSGNYMSPGEGAQSLTWVATDLADNISTTQSTVIVSSKILYGELVTVRPNSANTHLVLIGSAKASRPGVQIKSYTGILGFSDDEVTSNADGSFQIQANVAASIKLKALDTDTGETAEATLSFSTGTSLSGIVRDSDDIALPGVRVSIQGQPFLTTTDANGAFNFSSVSSGDQTIVFDGTTATQASPGPVRKFSVSKMRYNIGLGQINVLSRPVYLAGVTIDGTETQVVANQSTVVTSPNAPGFELSVGANTSIFPAGFTDNVISAKEILSDRATVAPPVFAEPTKVIALEPSGLSFSQRTNLTLNNDNLLPANTQMVIFSMNSNTGEWEIDGVGAVTADGSQIKTKPGSGISHFSLIYAVPAKPYITEVTDPNLQGVDISRGSLTENISLPSFKSLGRDINPGLIYKSSWASPTAFVSNRIDIPNFPLTTQFNGHDLIVREECSPYGCSIGEVQVKIDNTITQTDESTIVPDKVRSQLFVGNLVSGISEFIDTTNLPANRGDVIPGAILKDSANTAITEMAGIPNRGVISYSVPLKDSTGQQSLPSGIYPYLARYEFFLKNLVVRSFSSVTKVFVNGDYKPEFSSSIMLPKNTFASALKDVLPQDVAGSLLVQNKSASEFGQGWKLNIGQTILNPQSSKLAVEDANGGLATYVPQQTISTLYSLPADNTYQTDSVTISSYPDIYLAKQVSGTNETDILHLNANSGFSNIETLRYRGSSGTIRNHNYAECPNLTGHGWWADELFQSTIWDWYYGGFNIYDHNYQVLPVIGGILPLPSGGALVSDQREHQMGIAYGWGSNHYAGVYTRLDNLLGAENLTRDEGNGSFQNLCNSVFGQNCSGATSAVQANCRPAWANDGVVPDSIGMSIFYAYNPGLSRDNWRQYHIYCYSYQFRPAVLVQNPGQIGTSGNGGDGNMGTNVGINQPGEIYRYLNNTALLVDRGNNRIRFIDLTTSVFSQFAGDGSNYDQGDNIPSTSAKILHPNALFATGTGDVFISSEKGYIRKVGGDGIIHLLGGLPVESGGVLASEGDVSNFALNNPQGLVFDENLNVLYISDTGNNRIVKFDLTTNKAFQIAGTGSCSVNPSGAPQLALSDNLCAPTKIAFDSDKNLVFYESGSRRIRKLNINNSNNSGPIIFAATNKDLSTLTKNPDGTFQRKYRNGSSVSYSKTGKETSESDRVGNTMSFAYDSSGLLLSVTDPTSRKLEITYNNGKVSSIRDPAGKITQFSYSGNMLARVDTPDGTHQNLEYSPEGLLTRKVNAAGNAVQYSYNKWNRLEKITDPNNKETMINDSVSASMSNDYIGGTAGQFAKSGTGANDIKDTVVDANNNPTKLAKDAHGFISKITDALNHTTVIERNLEGLTTAVTYPDNAKVTFNYDPTTRDLLSSTDVNTGITESATYDSFGNNLTKTNGNGQVARSSFDPNTGLLLSQTAPGGQSISYAYGVNGQLASKTIFPQSGQSQSSTFEYDSSGNLTRVVSPDGKQTQFGYDLVGNQVQTISFTNGTATATTNYNYDPLNRLTKVTSPNGEITEYSYLATGELSTIKDPKGKIRTFEYDKLGRLTKKIDSLGQIYLLSYDAGGNLIQETDPNGNIKKYSYDVLNEMIQVQLPDDLISYQYDARGKVTQASNNSSSINWIRDSKSRIIYERADGIGAISDYPVVELSTTYDGANNRTNLDAGTVSLSYSYDASSRLVSMANSNGDTFNFGYDQANRLTALLRPGSRTDYTYKPSGVVDSIIHSAGGVTKAYAQYGYDLRNFPVQKRSIAGTASYSYDGNGQLTGVTGPSGNENFGYDPLGNRVSDQLGSYTYDTASQRLTEDWQYNYTYDNNGNMIAKIPKDASKAATTYSYNSKNQLTRVQITSTVLGPVAKDVSYAYDVLGRRMEKKITDLVDSTKSYARRFVYDGENILFEYEGASNMLASYTHSPLAPDDILSASITNAGVTAGLASSAGHFYYLKDSLGSVTDVVNTSGNLVQKYDYSAFGRILSIKDGAGVEISANPILKTSFTFTGREWDEEAGLYYYRARTYNPEIGRFLQTDPDPGRLNSPITLNNPYGYATNRPTQFTDPSGKWIFVVGIVIAALIGGSISDRQGNGFLSGAILGAAAFASGYAAGAFAAGYFGGSGVAAFAASVTFGAAAGAAAGAIISRGLGMGTAEDGAKMGAALGTLGALTSYFSLSADELQDYTPHNLNVTSAYRDYSAFQHGLLPRWVALGLAYADPYLFLAGIDITRRKFEF